MTVPQGYVPVSRRELRRLWTECRNRGVLYNGMTGVLLRRRYRGGATHVAGVGFFKDAQIRPLTYQKTFIR